MTYEYDKDLFSKEQQDYIDKAIENNAEKELLDIMTLTDKDNNPVFDVPRLYNFYMATLYKYSIDSIKICGQLNKEGKPMFNTGQIKNILEAASNLSSEQLNFLLKVNKDGNPIYNEFHMKEIISGFNSGLSIEDVKFYAKLSSNDVPIYNSLVMKAIKDDMVIRMDKEKILLYAKLNNNNEEMIYPHGIWQAIRDDIRDGYSEEKIGLYAALDENQNLIFTKAQVSEIRIGLIYEMPKEKIEIFANPKFNPKQITDIREFLFKANDEQCKQIKKCIKEKMKYNKFKILLNPNLSADKIRILKSIKLLDYSDECIKKLIDNKYSYEDLKEIKYLIQCTDKLIGRNNIDRYLDLDVDEFKYSLSYDICVNNKIDILARGTIEKCIDYKMTPEEISFIINSDFSVEEMRYVSVAILAGASFNEIKENHKLAQSVLGDETIPTNFKTDFDIIKEK